MYLLQYISDEINSLQETARQHDESVIDMLL